jgi:hypothetical protein
MGGTVEVGQAFDVAHLIDPQHGGTDTLDNVGPAHPACNRSDGGKVGAAIRNASRRTVKRMPTW